MFGLNDNDTETKDSNNPAATPDNPFGGNDQAAATSPTPADDPGSTAPAADTPAPAHGSAPDDLLDLKQQALQSLQPLVNHLEQTPEEKFKTTMMLIQATDNSSLVKQAYDAANQISDEKIRAQALLDVVNEINYFTHHAGGEEETKA